MRFVRFRFDRMLAVFFWLSVSQTLGVVYKEASSVNFPSADMRRSLFWVVIHPLGWFSFGSRAVPSFTFITSWFI